MELDFERCYRAVDSRDQRFDGWFYTAVTSTGIYCRPSCPAITPKRENVRFYPSAAAAQRAGLPGLPPLPAGRRAGLTRVGRPRRRGRPRDAPDRRRRRRPRGRTRARRPARLHRAPPAPDAHRRGRRRPARAGPGAARPDRPDPDRDDRPRPRRDRVRGRLRQRAAVQRHDPRGVRRRRRRRCATARNRRKRRPRPASSTLRLAYRPPLHADALLDFLAAAGDPGHRGGRDGHVPPGAAPAARHRRGRADAAPGHGAAPRGGDAAAHGRARPGARGRPLPPPARPGRRPGGGRRARSPPTRRWPRPSTKEPGVRVPRAVDGFEMAVRAIVGQQISVAGRPCTSCGRDRST